MIDAAEIVRQTVRSEGLGGPDRAEASAAAEKGSALGMEVEMMEDPLAQLQDSMEEISGMFEEKTLKDIGERKLGKEHARESQLIKAVENWAKLMPDLPSRLFIERLLRQLQSHMRSMMVSSELLKQLGRGSSDPSHQYAMLDILEQGLDGDDEALAVVRSARRQLEAEKGAEVRAGLNLAEEINSRSSSPEEIRELRDLYRGEVLGFERPQECFRSLLASRGAGRLAEAIDFLIVGAGIDLQSASPSRSPEQLRAIILDLQSVEVLRTVLDSCEGLIAKMNGEFGEVSLLSAEKLIGSIVDMTELPFVNSGNVERLVRSCGFMQLLARLYFTTRLTELFRRLSPRFFADEQGRQGMIDAAQEHLDGLVAQQEEAEANDADKGKGSAA